MMFELEWHAEMLQAGSFDPACSSARWLAIPTQCA